MLLLLALFPKSSELALKQLKNATKTSYFKYSLHKSTGVYIRGRQTLGCNLVPVREKMLPDCVEPRSNYSKSDWNN